VGTTNLAYGLFARHRNVDPGWSGANEVWSLRDKAARWCQYHKTVLYVSTAVPGNSIVEEQVPV